MNAQPQPVYRPCRQCGLQNIPERRMCKRCGATLDSAGDALRTKTPTVTFIAGQRDGRLGSLAWLLPRMRLQFTTSRSLDDTSERLAALLSQTVTRTSGTGWLSDSRRYEGEVRGDTLLVRGPYGQKKWTLVTTGRMTATPSGTRVLLEMRPAPASALGLIFLAVWVIGACAMMYGTPLILFPPLGGALMYGVSLIGIRSEAGDIAAILAEALTPTDTEHGLEPA